MFWPLQQTLSAARHVAIIIHPQPDGDAIGSAVALKLALEQTKKVTIVCAHPAPDIFKIIVGDLVLTKTLPLSADCIVVLDAGDLKFLGYGAQLKRLHRIVPIIVIDHHIQNDIDQLAKYVLRDTSASSTAEILAQYASLLQPISAQIATALLMGIFTDTNSFRNNNTTANTLKQSSWLIRQGADLALISKVFNRRLNTTQRKVWGRMLENSRVTKMQLVVSTLSRSELLQLGATVQDAAGLANLLAVTTEAKAALVLLETEAGWRGVLRTRHTQVDIGRLAKYLGGNGTNKAAGFPATKDEFSGIINKQ